MMPNAKEVLKKYDRSVVAIATAVGIIATAYLSVGSKVDDLIAKSPTIINLTNKVDNNEKLQNQINVTITEQYRELNRKLDYLVRK